MGKGQEKHTKTPKRVGIWSTLVNGVVSCFRNARHLICRFLFSHLLELTMEPLHLSLVLFSVSGIMLSFCRLSFALLSISHFHIVIFSRLAFFGPA